jgi:hypothetical protein
VQALPHSYSKHHHDPADPRPEKVTVTIREAEYLSHFSRSRKGEAIWIFAFVPHSEQSSLRWYLDYPDVPVGSAAYAAKVGTSGFLSLL